MTGAGGRTGKLVLQKLLGRPEHFEARGLVRTPEVGLLQQCYSPLPTELLSLPVPLSCGLWSAWALVGEAILFRSTLPHFINL